jgi:hypothetical protein
MYWMETSAICVCHLSLLASLPHIRGAVETLQFVVSARHMTTVLGIRTTQSALEVEDVVSRIKLSQDNRAKTALASCLAEAKALRRLLGSIRDTALSF